MKELVFHYDFQPRRESVLVGRSRPNGNTFQVELTQPWRNPVGEPVPGRILDLLDLVQAVFAVDRQSPRQPDSDGYGWERSLYLALPVREFDFWSQREIRDQIQNLLNFLTVDDWHLQWWPHPYLDHSTPLQLPLIKIEQPPTAFILHSGGLDSLAGACDLILKDDSIRTDFVSVILADRVAGVQREVYERLDQRWRGRVRSAEVQIGLSEPPSGLGIHRSRSFIFQSLGALAAYNSGSMELLQCENGVASLGLSLLRGALPWQTSRGVHPRFLSGMSAFLSSVFDREFRVVNPYLFWTKAEMCSAIESAGLISAIGLSVSCDRFPQRVEGKPLCGKCGPCLLRRQALFASGLAACDPSERYRYDVTNPKTRIPRDARLHLDAMFCQRERLRSALAEQEPWQALTRDFPDLDGTTRFVARATAAETGQTQREICRMLARYVKEWELFPIREAFRDVPWTYDRRRVRLDIPQERQTSLLEITGQVDQSP